MVYLFISSCSPDEIVFRPGERHTLSFDMQVPSQTSKVPTCKVGEPDRVAYSITNSRDEQYVYFADLLEIDGRYISQPIELTIGNYTINSIDLIRGEQVFYSVPDQSDGTILHYANLILPFDFSMNDDVRINAKAFCYDVAPTPSVEGILQGGFEANRLGSLFFYVQDRECTAMVTVTIDAYRIPEVIIFSTGTYEVAIPQEYTSMSVRSYNSDGEEIGEPYEFTADEPYNPQSLLIINNTCS